MSLLSWIGRKIGLTDHKFWREFYSTETWAGETVNLETAMQVSAFWACVRLTSQTIATLPLSLYQKDEAGSRLTRSDHPLYRILHEQPNADQTAVELWEGVVACLCVYGNAFVEKIIGTGNRITSLVLLHPDYIQLERLRDGRRKYRFSDPSSDVRDLTEDQIMHVKGFGFGGELGLSPVAYARQTISSVRATERAAAQTFANGMRPSGWLVYKGGGTLKPEQREQIRKNIIAPMQGAENAGKIGILEADFDYRQITIPPEDAQMLESRSFGVEEVCRWFGTPPILVGHAGKGQTMWGSGIEQIFNGWAALGLRPYLTRVEQAIKRSLLTPGERQEGLYPEFMLEGLLRADSSSRGELYWKLMQMGAITPNQICDKENFPRFDGGDTHFINQTLAPLSNVSMLTPMPSGAAPTLTVVGGRST